MKKDNSESGLTSHKPTLNLQGFLGIDKNPKVSLFEYGLLIQNTRGDEYQAYYKISGNEYDIGFFYKSEINDILEEKSWATSDELTEMLKSCGQSKRSFMKLPFIYKILSLRNYFGNDIMFGPSYDTMNQREIWQTITNENSN